MSMKIRIGDEDCYPIFSPKLCRFWGGGGTTSACFVRFCDISLLGASFSILLSRLFVFLVGFFPWVWRVEEILSEGKSVVVVVVVGCGDIV